MDLTSQLLLGICLVCITSIRKSGGYYDLLLLRNRKQINGCAYGLFSGSSSWSDRSCRYYKLILLHNRKRLNACVSPSTSASSTLSDRSCECYKLQLMIDESAYTSASSPFSGRSCKYYIYYSCLTIESDSMSKLLLRLQLYLLYQTVFVGIIDYYLFVT